jgi:signal peptidase I
MAGAYAPWIIRTRKILARLIFLALLWIWVMPRTIGGLNTFTVVSGISMEPTFHTGDLIISRKADHYNVGDVVTYKIPEAKYKKFRVVHRVVGKTDDGRYEIRGDNQDHADPWSVPGENIAGSKVVMIPRGGSVLGYARNPIGLALLFGALVTWTFWPRKPNGETGENIVPQLFDRHTLIGRDSPAEEELLVVGTSLTYAQFLNRPSLRGVAQTPTLPDLGTTINEPLHERSFFHDALFEQHLADWSSHVHTVSDQPDVSDQSDQPDVSDQSDQSDQLGERNSTFLQNLVQNRNDDVPRIQSEPIIPEPTVTEPGPTEKAIIAGPTEELGEKPTVDELLERWMNDEADSPLPEFLASM